MIPSFFIVHNDWDILQRWDIYNSKAAQTWGPGQDHVDASSSGSSWSQGVWYPCCECKVQIIAAADQKVSSAWVSGLAIRLQLATNP